MADIAGRRCENLPTNQLNMEVTKKKMVLMDMGMQAVKLLFGRVARGLGGLLLLLMVALPHLTNAGTAKLAAWGLPTSVSFLGGLIVLPISIGLMISAIWA